MSMGSRYDVGCQAARMDALASPNLHAPGPRKTVELSLAGHTGGIDATCTLLLLLYEKNTHMQSCQRRTYQGNTGLACTTRDIVSRIGSTPGRPQRRPNNQSLAYPFFGTLCGILAAFSSISQCALGSAKIARNCFFPPH